MLDNFEKLILKLLQKDGRAPTQDIADYISKREARVNRVAVRNNIISILIIHNV